MPCQTSEAFIPNVHRLLGIGSEIIRCLLVQFFCFLFYKGFFFFLVLIYFFKACGERWQVLFCLLFFLFYKSSGIKEPCALKMSNVVYCHMWDSDQSLWWLEGCLNIELCHAIVTLCCGSLSSRGKVSANTPLNLSTQIETLVPEMKACLKGSCSLKQTIFNPWNSKRKLILRQICFCETSISFCICRRYSCV